MITTLSKSSIIPETMLYQAVVDHEFRAEIADNTSNVPGMDLNTFLLPDAVERQEQESLKIWSEGLAAVDVYNCTSSCSYGQITIICDGTTK